MTTKPDACHHEHARFFTVQKLGELPAVELWHCPACKSTLSADTLKAAGHIAASGE